MIGTILSRHRIRIIMAGLEEAFEVDGLGNRSTSLAVALSRREEVEKLLVINCPRARVGRAIDNLLGKKQIEDMYQEVKRGKELSILKVNNKLFMLNSTVVFPENARFFSYAERKSLSRKIASAVEKMDFNPDLLWISNPRIVDSVSDIRAKLRYFDAIDDLRIHPQLRRFEKQIRSAYRWIERNADKICIASEDQRTMFPGNDNLFLLPNGVDEIFTKGIRTGAPSDLEQIPRPIVMYAGALQERLDKDLIADVAKSLRTFSFVFIGPELIPGYFDDLKKLRNIHFLGSKRFEKMPDYISQADACIIPHKLDEFTRSMNPLKIYEYLACGKPVITTPVAGVDRFSECLYLAESPAEFASALQRAIAENDPVREAARREAVSMHTWSARAGTLLAMLGGPVGRKGTE